MQSMKTRSFPLNQNRNLFYLLDRSEGSTMIMKMTKVMMVMLLVIMMVMMMMTMMMIHILQQRIKEYKTFTIKNHQRWA